MAVINYQQLKGGARYEDYSSLSIFPFICASNIVAGFLVHFSSLGPAQLLSFFGDLVGGKWLQNRL